MPSSGSIGQAPHAAVWPHAGLARRSTTMGGARLTPSRPRTTGPHPRAALACYCSPSPATPALATASHASSRRYVPPASRPAPAASSLSLAGCAPAGSGHIHATPQLMPAVSGRPALATLPTGSPTPNPQMKGTRMKPVGLVSSFWRSTENISIQVHPNLCEPQSKHGSIQVEPVPTRLNPPTKYILTTL